MADLHPALAQSALVAKPSRITRFLGWSAGIHLGMVLTVMVFNQFFKTPSLKLDQEPIKASLVRLGKPRDPKMLPRKEEPPPPPPVVKPEAAPVKAEAPAPVPAAIPIPSPKSAPTPPRSAGQKSADARQKLFGALNSMSKAPTEPLEGAEDGDRAGDSARQEGERYFGMLSAQVHRHYDVSQTISDQERMYLKARVAVRIGRGGEVMKVALAQGSGNELFDAAVVAAVKRASPFSPPPDHLRDALQTKGIVLEFKP